MIAIVPTSLLLAALLFNELRVLGLTGSRFAGLFTLALYLGLASHAGRFFVEARRSGLLELLLGSPLASEEIVRGQWRGLLRRFAVPLLLWALVLATGVFLQQRTWATIGAVTVGVSPSGPTDTTLQTWLSMGRAILLGVTVLANCLALAWFGMWMGLTSKTGPAATAKTMVFVQIIPWFVISFAAMLVVPLLLASQLLGAPGRFFIWFPLLMSTVSSALFLLKDVLFFWWSRKKLYSCFRERALAVVPHRVVLPPPLPTAPSALALREQR